VQSLLHKKGVLKGHSGAIYALDYDFRTGFLLSGGADKLVTAWNVEKGESAPFQALFPAPVYSMCLVPDKNLLLVGTSAGSIHIIDLIRKEEIKILQHHTAQIFDLRYSSSQNSFYSLGGDGNFAQCSLETLSLLRIKKFSTAKLRQMDFHPQTQDIALACGDGRILILDIHTLEIKKEFPAHHLSANAVRYHPSGKFLVSGGKDAYLNVWDLEDYVLTHSIPAHNFAIYSIRFSPDQQLFATASRDKTIKLWDASSFAFLERIDAEKSGGHINSVNVLLWGGNSGCLVSAGDDRSILAWEQESSGYRGR
jgi:WD40 repeat protein